MIKKYQNSAGVLTRFLDVILVFLAWLAAYPVRFQWFQFIPFSELPSAEHYFALVPLVLLVWMGGFQFFGLYRYDRVLRRSTEFYTLLKANIGNLILFTSLTYFITQFRFSRGVILVFGVLVFFACVLSRVITRKIFRELTRKGVYTVKLVAIGDSPELKFLIQQFLRYPELGVHLEKRIEPQEYSQALEIIKNIKPRMVLISLSRDQSEAMDQIIRVLKDEPIDLHMIPSYTNYMALGASVGNFYGIPLIQLNDSPLTGYRSWIKRWIDFVLSGLGLLILSPLFLVIMIAIKITSRGAIFYRQERMGLDGTTFMMYKFRSMSMDAEEKSGAVWAVENDDRRTSIGKTLRATSLDELPQLWNVFIGNMSLVGPRPERPYFVDKFRHEIPNYMLRHRVKTGITGWAQINGWRGDTSLEKRIECDLYYIRNWSPWLDFKILLLTFLKGFINKNAY